MEHYNARSQSKPAATQQRWYREHEATRKILERAEWNINDSEQRFY
jgi:uncharacterized protein YukE